MLVRHLDACVILVTVRRDAEQIDVIVWHACGEYISVEEPIHVDDGGFGEGVAELL